jgi:phage repressor protein C with HTH and peptisase S24 domain
MGIPRTSLINYEKDVSNPSADFLILLQEKFNISIDWFLTDRGSMFLPTTDSPSSNGLTISQAQYSEIGNIQQLTMTPSRETTHESLSSSPPEEMPQPAQHVRAMTVFEIPLLTREQVLQFDPVKEIPVPKAHSGEYPDSMLVPMPRHFVEYSTDLRAMVVFNSLMSPLLNPGEIAIFQATGWNSDGVYVYRMSGDLYISYVKPYGKDYRLIKEFRQDEEISYDSGSFEVIGRVRAVIREIG